MVTSAAPGAAPATRADRLRGLPWRHADVLMATTALAIAALGVLMVWTATRTRQASAGLDPQGMLKRQALWVAIGLLAAGVTLFVDYRRLAHAAPAAYAAVLLGLLVVLSPLGASALGAQRWISVAGFQLQPAAFASLALILTLAAVCEHHHGTLPTRAVLVALAVALPLIGLVMVQPDLGSAIILGVITVTTLVVAGARGRHLALLAAGCVLAAIAVVQLGILKHYQVQRLTAFMDQGHNTQQAAYNLTQSKIAIGSGGLTGKGLFHGTQTNLSYVPEQQTDFIFAAVGEQLGFAGSALLLAGYALIVWRVWVAMRDARDTFGTLICAGVLGMIVIQVFENSGMTMGIMPITGIPLPLMSYGGSSTIVMLIAVALAENVHMHRYS